MKENLGSVARNRTKPPASTDKIGEVSFLLLLSSRVLIFWFLVFGQKDFGFLLGHSPLATDDDVSSSCKPQYLLVLRTTYLNS